MARKNTDGSPIGAYSCPSSQRGCAVVNKFSAVQFYCPRATKLSLPVHDLPSRNSRPNGGYCPTALQPFRSFPCAHSAVRGGFCPSSFYAAPWRILAFTTRSHTTSQNSNYAILPNYGRILSQSIVLCERNRKPSIHAGLRTFIFKIAGSGNAY